MDFYQYEIVYNFALGSLLTYASRDDIQRDLGNDVVFYNAERQRIMQSLRVTLEDVRSDLLDQFPDVEGPDLADVLWDAAREAWGSDIVSDL